MKEKNPTQECYKDVIKQTKKTLHQVQSWNPLYTECSIKNSSVLRTRQEFKNASAFLLMPVLSPPLGKSDFWSAPWRESHPHRTLGYPLLLLRPHTLLTSIYSPTLSSWWQMTVFWYQDLPYSSQHMETCTGFAFRISEVLPTKDIVVSETGSLSASHLHFSFERWEKNSSYASNTAMKMNRNNAWWLFSTAVAIGTCSFLLVCFVLVLSCFVLFYW